MAGHLYTCRNCGFVVDVAKGVSEERAHGNLDCQVAPDPRRQRIDEFPIIWQCPECGSSRDDYEESPDALPPEDEAPVVSDARDTPAGQAPIRPSSPRRDPSQSTSSPDDVYGRDEDR